jgi:hypothetical protein
LAARPENNKEEEDILPKPWNVSESRNGGGGRRPNPDDERILDGSAVQTYAGYKADESPRAILSAGGWVEIVEIIERRRVEDEGSGRRREAFLCRLGDGATVFLVNLGDGRWSLKSGAERG